MTLFEAIEPHVDEWRKNHFPCDDAPAIREILEWSAHPETSVFHLRAPQQKALETYWYLRLIEGTPPIIDLYGKYYPQTSERIKALGADTQAVKDYVMDDGFAGLTSKIKNDDNFVKQNHLEALRETLTLLYPSYILALAMGAGKTVLIGAIYASEFAMAMEYPGKRFVQNALVFAPGKTIIESLRELAAMRYESILPPRMYKNFSSSLKLTFTRDGDPNIPIILGSKYNVVVTNTEKIRIQKESILRASLGKLFAAQREDEARIEVANLRLQAIASLPNLAVFSDEAHHTYGQAMDEDLKKVRKTVDYLNNPYPAGSKEAIEHHSNLVCVVNTTGTPYFKHQPLKDVVVWYGLSEGIRDGILKEVSGNIQAYEFDDDIKPYLETVVSDFFANYAETRLEDGIPAKLAIFFPQTDDAMAFRPIIEKKMVELGFSTDLILEHHSANEQKEEFDRFRISPKRVAILVNRGVEGWNVPALFACALARKLKSANNFVLQAASRCLRQIPGNTTKAKIYLSMDNRDILDTQLQETYGETLARINETESLSQSWKITLRKQEIPALVVRKTRKTVSRVEREHGDIELRRPEPGTKNRLTRETYDLGVRGLEFIRDKTVIEYEAERISLYETANLLAREYRLKPMELLRSLEQVFGDEKNLNGSELRDLAGQIESQTSNYAVEEEVVEEALALIKKEGFSREEDGEGNEIFTADIMVPINRLRLLAHYREWKERSGLFGFHYDPYNFDSAPEQNFFEQILHELKTNPAEVEDIYFTGAVTDPQKTDFFIDYLGEDSNWHRYSPDFLIRLRNGKCLIIEVKREHERQHPVDGENGLKAAATRRWVSLNPEKLKYQMLFVSGDSIGFDEMRDAKEFCDGC